MSESGRLVRGVDVDARADALAGYPGARETFRSLFGYDLAITFGTLLAHASGRAPDPADAVATTYLSRHDDAAAVRAELLEIACTLIARGEDVEVLRRSHLRWRVREDAVVDVFASWTRGADLYVAPTVAGPHASVVARGVEEVTIDGRAVLVPSDVEGTLLALYGPGWRALEPGGEVLVGTPDVETNAVVEALREVTLDDVDLARVHWTRFYGEDRPLPAPSPFAQWVAARLSPEPGAQPGPVVELGAAIELDTVIELGCGNGRDTAAVAQGRRALGLDYSPTAIERNRRLWSGIEFRRADVSDPASLEAATAGYLDDGPVAIYSRFFLHAISDDAEDVLREFLRRALPAGSVLFLEFRTERDKDTPKVFGEHYRRFVDPDALVQRFRDGGHFDVVHDERGHGLAVYKDEDPYVARLVLTKRTPGSTPGSRTTA